MLQYVCVRRQCPPDVVDHASRRILLYNPTATYCPGLLLQAQPITNQYYRNETKKSTLCSLTIFKLPFLPSSGAFDVKI